MTKALNSFDVYLEIGQKRTFASVIEWPGWCRLGCDETAALQALFEAGPRYEHILRPTKLGLQLPQDASALVVVERLKGNATTDFGAPDLAPARDADPIDDNELKRFQSILEASWQALDAAVENARGKSLRAGPRGGGRTIDGILEHVQSSEISYLSSLGGKVTSAGALEPSLQETRRAILETLAASAHGEIAERGPRGGKRWLPRYFVRRLVWHVLDHVWEIEDRMM